MVLLEMTLQELMSQTSELHTGNKASQLVQAYSLYLQDFRIPFTIHRHETLIEELKHTLSVQD